MISKDKILNNKIYMAALYVLSGNGLSKVIRLISNIILTRLLVPEYFGIIALARTIDLGIALFSDIGIQPGIIRSKRSNDEVFLNTAWTLAILRGFILWPLSVVLAFPAANFYGESILRWVIPLLALNFIVNAFRSTSLPLMSKELKQDKLVTIELTIQVINVTITIILAYFLRNIWALIIGNIISEIIRTIWSHLIKGYPRMRFALERESVKELLSFGKWIFFSTAMTFLSNQIDRLLLGKILTTTIFGVYYIAIMFADLPKKIIASLSQKVLYPVYSSLSNLSREEIKEKITQKRYKALMLIASCIAVFACFGDIIIIILYDDRYLQAAWMLPILILGIWPRVLIESVANLLLAINKPNYVAFGNALKVIYMVIFLPLSFHLYGLIGAIIAIALNDIPSYLMITYGLIRERLGLWKQDLLGTFLMMGIVIVIVSLRLFLGFDYPVIN